MTPKIVLSSVISIKIFSPFFESRYLSISGLKEFCKNEGSFKFRLERSRRCQKKL